MEICVRLPVGDGTFRDVTACLPRDFASEVRYIFCADGQSVPLLIENLRQEFAADSVAFIGVHSRREFRAREYVQGRDDSHFDRHEQFFVNVVRDWVQHKFSVELDAKNTVCFGYSCGGSFAVSMGIRHADLFGSVIALSVAGRPVRVDKPPSKVLDLSQSWFYLAAGESEVGGMKKYMKRLSIWLAKHGGQSEYRLSRGGHEVAVWQYELLRGLAWLRDSLPLR